ncbi:hypothetical protein BDW62DRAFT_191698 [Aspergillus aurantiobrunneus]
MLFKSSYLYKYYKQTSVRCCCTNGNRPNNICEDILGRSCAKLGCKGSKAICL